MTNKKELISRITINKTICSILNFQLKFIKIITFVGNYTESLNFYLSDESVSQINCHDTNHAIDKQDKESRVFCVLLQNYYLLERVDQ